MSKNYDFRVRCTGYEQMSEKYFTIGKVYRVKDGILTSDAGFKYDAWNYHGKTFKNLKNWFSGYYTFELVEDYPTIVITTDGKTTTAKKYYPDGRVDVGVAECHPEDTFDFDIGVKVALERLFGSDKSPKEDCKVKTGIHLTTDELKKMHNRCVWLSDLNSYCAEYFTTKWCGWFVVDVENEKLVRLADGSRYCLNSNDRPCGFRAYLSAPEFIK